MVNNLVRQAFALRARFPDAKTKLTPTRFVWTGRIQPNELSRVYTVRISLVDGRYPRVDVLDPVLEGRPGESIPHRFEDNSLCLHLENEWNPTMMMVDTTIPWTSEWLLNYEIWKAIGVWYGGGEWPPRRPGRDQDSRDQDSRDQDSRDQDSRDQDSRDQDSFVSARPSLAEAPI